VIRQLPAHDPAILRAYWESPEGRADLERDRQDQLRRRRDDLIREILARGDGAEIVAEINSKLGQRRKAGS
jgi:hypothetical protein